MPYSLILHSHSQPPCTFPYKATFFISLLHFSSAMVPAEVEKPRVTEIQVRMDCNGCVQKIKKALHGINGIYDIYFDFPQQKLTVIGWADPEKIVKAIKKTRKIATICSHIEATPSPSPPPDHPPEGGARAPPPESENPPPEAPATETQAPPATEPPKDPPPPETPPPDAPPAQPTEGQPPQHSKPKDEEQVHVVYHHPPDYSHRYGYAQAYSSPAFRHEPPQPIQVNHSYNTYKPSPYVTEYINYSRPEPPQYSQYSRPEPPQYTQYSRPEPPQYTQYNRPEPSQYTQYSRPEPPQYTQYSRPEPPQNMHYSRTEPTSQYTHYSRSEPPQHVNYSRTEPTTRYTQYSRPEPSQYIHHNRMEQYSEDYYHGSNNGNSNITSIFSDENPNACRIV